MILSAEFRARSLFFLPRPQSSSASRFTAGPFGSSSLASPVSGRAGRANLPLRHDALKAHVSVKKFRVAALRTRECAIATAQAETRGLRLGALRPYRLGGVGDRWFLWKPTVAAVAVCALACSSSLTPYLPPFSTFFPARIIGSRLASRREHSSAPRGNFPKSNHREMVALVINRTAPARPKLADQPLKQAQPEHRRALIPS